MAVRVSRFDVYLVALDPTQGSEIKKTRPCVVISPNELNWNIRTVIIAPMTTKDREYPTRISVSFNGKAGDIVLDQIRTIDKARLLKHVGKVTEVDGKHILAVLQKMFSW